MPYRNIGIYYEKRGEFDKAIRYLERAVEINPREGNNQEHLERVYRRKTSALTEERPDEDFRSADRVGSLNRMGIERGRIGDLDGAIAIFEKALKLDSENAETYNNLGFAYFMKKDYRDAETCFQKAIEIEPTHEKANKNLRFLQQYKE